MVLDATIAVMTLVGALAALCAVLVVVLRRSPALIWLAIALCIGNVETFVMTASLLLPVKMAILSCTVALSLGCVGQAVRTAYGCGLPAPPMLALFFGLIATSLLLLAAGVPAVWQMAPSALAGMVACGDAMQAVHNARRRGDIVDKSLRIVLAANAMIYALRIPVFPLLIGQATPFRLLSAEEATAIVVIAFTALVPAAVFLIVARVLSDLLDSYRQRAERDFMTDLPNRRSFEERLRSEGKRGGAMILCDIDNFKAVNDRFGHAAGDAVICAFSALLDDTGYAARMGGEEFAIFLPGACLDDASAYAERLRREFESLRVLEIDEDYAVTASFGLAPFEQNASLQAVSARADAALYRAKNTGRNRVVVARGETESRGVVRQYALAAA